MSESPDTAPPATFESLEAELERVTRRLEDASIPLEERLGLHSRAASMHRQLEAILEEARRATGTSGSRTTSDDAAVGVEEAEPYEVVRDRLAEVVNALEADDLALGRVVALHREAQLLAARCEAILDAAQEQIDRTASVSGDPVDPAPRATNDAPSSGGDDPNADAPF